MTDFRFLLVVARRDQCEEYIDFLKHHGAETVFAAMCRGAAREKTLDLLGLEPTEKVLLSTLCPARRANSLLRRLVREMRIDAPNSGAAFTVSVDGISGASALEYLCGDEIIKTGEVSKMQEAPYSLIIAIADKGQSGLVISAANAAGARSGTLVHAKEVGPEGASKFFGVTIAEEKEQILFVVPAAKRDDVLRGIMTTAGVRSPAHAVAFSLPVEAAVGLTVPMEEDE